MIDEIDLRCGCSRLLFKRKDNRLEIKCARCKSVHAITFEQICQFFQTGVFCQAHSQSIRIDAKDLDSAQSGLPATAFDATENPTP